MRVVEQQAAVAVHDLVLDAADPRGDDRPGLPHRLRHGKPEALRDALLHDHTRVPLERVDDDRVLLGVLHRKGRQVDAAAGLVGQRLAQGDRVAPHALALRVVGDRLHRRTGVHEVGAGVRGHVLGEAANHPERVLEGVPARDLEDHGHIGTAPRARG
jgi:hypothetical protein